MYTVKWRLKEHLRVCVAENCSLMHHQVFSIRLVQAPVWGSKKNNNPTSLTVRVPVIFTGTFRARLRVRVRLRARIRVSIMLRVRIRVRIRIRVRLRARIRVSIMLRVRIRVRIRIRVRLRARIRVRKLYLPTKFWQWFTVEWV